MDMIFERINTEELKIQSIVIPNRNHQSPEEWQYEIKKRLRKLRLGK